MKLTYRMAREGREWWADCVEVDAFAGGRTAFEAICRLRALLHQRFLAEDPSFQSQFGGVDLSPATTAYIDVPVTRAVQTHVPHASNEISDSAPPSR